MAALTAKPQHQQGTRTTLMLLLAMATGELLTVSAAGSSLTGTDGPTRRGGHRHSPTDNTLLIPATLPTVELRPGVAGGYSIAVGGRKWYESTPSPRICVGGITRTLTKFQSGAASSGSDEVGDWMGVSTAFGVEDGALGVEPGALVEQTLKRYKAVPTAAVLTTRFLRSIDTSGCSKHVDKYPNPDNSVVAEALALNTSFHAGRQLQIMSWGHHLDLKATGRGLVSLSIDSVLDGPVVSHDREAGQTLVWSTLDSHKVVPQQNSGGVYSMGLSTAFRTIEARF
eukprot:COSAG02_NODE_12753_length_1499_cov_12.516429_2_plen_283_part_01